jgi:hypothetical protein
VTVSPNAARACSKWLDTCRELGWRREDMPFLCDLWWKYHDDDGQLYPSGQSRPPQPGNQAQE